MCGNGEVFGRVPNRYLCQNISHLLPPDSLPDKEFQKKKLRIPQSFYALRDQKYLQSPARQIESQDNLLSCVQNILTSLGFNGKSQSHPIDPEGSSNEPTYLSSWSSNGRGFGVLNF